MDLLGTNPEPMIQIMSGYSQYCPIAKGAEVFAERWTPLIIRNLHLGCRSFNEIHEGVPRMSRTLLVQRLRFLERAQVIERRPIAGRRGSHYYLTPSGQELYEVSRALGDWGARWLELAPEDYDPEIVMWAWKRRIDMSKLPRRRVVVRFDIADRPKQRFWLVLEPEEVELCVKHPGFDEDVVVTTTLQALTRVHMGRLSMVEARREGEWTVQGPRDLVRAFPTWGGISPFANVHPVGSLAAVG
jgi:DNA-binding HxlR family transcriptional regulator